MWLRFRNYAVAILLFQLLIVLIGVVLFANLPWLAERVANAVKAPPPNQTPSSLIAWIEDNDFTAITDRVIQLYDESTKHVVLVYDAVTSDIAQAQNRLSGAGVSVTELISSRSIPSASHELQAFFTANRVADVTVVGEWYHGRRNVCTVQSTVNGSMLVNFAQTETSFSSASWGSSEAGVLSIANELAKTAYYALMYQIPFSGCWAGDFPFVLIMFYAGITFILSSLLVGALHAFTIRQKLLDAVNQRSLHKIPTPRGGGIVISTLTLSMLIIFSLSSSDLPPLLLAVYILTAGLLTGVSLYDDWVRYVPTKVRLVTHLLAGLMLVITTVALRPLAIAIPMLGVTMLVITGVFAVALLALWIAGFTNMFNFMDGADGIAGLQAVFAGTGWSILFFLEGESTLSLISLLVVATSVGFLVHNISPARIFMGDSGSVFLGFTLASLPVLGFVSTGNPDIFVVGGMFVLPFVVDTTYTIIRRWRNGENVLQAHRKHLYQRLVLRGHSHGGVTGLYGVIIVVCVVSGALYYTGDFIARSIVLMVVGVIMLTYVIAVEYLLALKPDFYSKRKPIEAASGVEVSQNL